MHFPREDQRTEKWSRLSLALLIGAWLGVRVVFESSLAKAARRFSHSMHQKHNSYPHLKGPQKGSPNVVETCPNSCCNSNEMMNQTTSSPTHSPLPNTNNHMISHRPPGQKRGNSTTSSNEHRYTFSFRPGGINKGCITYFNSGLRRVEVQEGVNPKTPSTTNLEPSTCCSIPWICLSWKDTQHIYKYVYIYIYIQIPF